MPSAYRDDHAKYYRRLSQHIDAYKNEARILSSKVVRASDPATPDVAILDRFVNPNDPESVALLLELVKIMLKEPHTPAAFCLGVVRGFILSLELAAEHCPSQTVFVNSILGKKGRRKKAA